MTYTTQDLGLNFSVKITDGEITIYEATTNNGVLLPSSVPAPNGYTIRPSVNVNEPPDNTVKITRR